MDPTAYDRVTDRLIQTTGYAAPRPGADWRCPAHDDKTPSLSVTPTEDRVLIKCQAGCDLSAVLGALGLSERDLFNDSTNGNGKSHLGEIVAVYPYANESGRTVLEVVRYLPKTFRQRVPDRNEPGGYRWKVADAEKVIYRLPQVLGAIRAGKTVWVVEGEKDVHALEARGQVATCNPGGAGKWRREYGLWFRGASVVIVADADEPGARHAMAVAEMLTPMATSVRVVQAACGKDAADHLAAGYGLEHFIPFVGAASPGDGRAESPEPAADVEANEPPELARLRSRLMDAEAIQSLPPPEWLIDGILPGNALAVLWGASGSTKSFLALDWALSLASGTWWHKRELKPSTVLYVAMEGESGIGKRIRAWSEANNVRGLDRIRWLVDTVNLLDGPEARALETVALEMAPRLIVVDTLARSIPGADENSAQDMGRLIQRLDGLRKATGATILLVHHATKEGSTARGSGALRGALDTEIEVRKEGETVGVSCRKQKDAEEFPVMQLQLETVGDSCVLRYVRSLSADDLPPQEKLRSLFVRNFGTIGASGTELVRTYQEQMGMGRTKAYQVVNTLMNDGFIRNAGTTKRPFYVRALPWGPE